MKKSENATISLPVKDACKLCVIVEARRDEALATVEGYEKKGERPPAWAVESVEEYTRFADAINKAIFDAV